MMGFDGYLLQLLDQLTGYPSGRRIIPIVGMGGIGKTTLAKYAYENLLTVNHFYVRAWVTVSQEFTASKILSEAISCLAGSTNEIDRNVDQLGEKLSKTLYGRRYLIVLDDVWSVDAWEKIMSYFPENNNGSRIVITTRQSEVVDYFGSSSFALEFLDENDSWELFCEKTFSQKSCPPELEEVGRKIVDKCKGLPLSITIIAGLLAKSSRTQEYWEKIEKDKSLILNSKVGNESLSILHLSYKHLPIRLSSCFLYLGLFPEDYKIPVPLLIKKWVAEGFIRQNKGQHLEEVAECYLKELIRRNLLLVSRVGQYKKLESCSIHDLVRDLCTWIAQKEKFFDIERETDGFIVDKIKLEFYSATSLGRPQILNEQQVVPSKAPPKSRLMRVYYQEFRADSSGFSFRQFNLRLLGHSPNELNYKLSSSISRIWSLQTLILTGLGVVAPSEIWNMPQLRHIEVGSICVPDPPSDAVLVLPNLQTLQRVHNLNFSEDVCKRIPNVKDLSILHYVHIQGEAASCSYSLENIGSLDKLESLSYSLRKCKCVGDPLHNLKFPSSLKELGLDGFELVWSNIEMISLLPHLQILDFLRVKLVGDEWSSVEFLRLKHLEIGVCADPIQLIAEGSNFPVLEKLSLGNLSNLEEIPSVGESATFQQLSLCRNK